MRIPNPAPKFRTDAELLQTAEVDERAGQRWRKPYLDGLCGLAFNLMRHGGRLIHDGTPTVHLPTETRTAFPPLLCSLLSDVESLFDVRFEARNRI